MTLVRGYVLAGGESSRMQRSDLPPDKALVLFEGETLLNRSIQRVSQVCASVSILCGTVERCGRLGVYGRTVVDRAAGCGPLGGLDAALQDAVLAGADAVLIVPVDMPHLPVKVLQFLLDTASESAVVCMQVEGFLQPLPAYVRVAAAGLIRSALGAGERKLLPVLDQVAVECGSTKGIYGVDAAWFDDGKNVVRRWFANVNTPGDLQSAQLPETLETRLHLSRHGE